MLIKESFCIKEGTIIQIGSTMLLYKLSEHSTERHAHLSEADFTNNPKAFKSLFPFRVFSVGRDENRNQVGK